MRQASSGSSRRAVDQVEQHASALDMAEEAVADAGALGRALDQAGNVGEHELAALVADDAELRAERRERIVADLGRGVGDRVEEGRLAGVGKPDQADVGEQLQAQPHPHLLARHRRSGAGAERGWSRSCSWRCRGRPCRPSSKIDALADLGEVGEQRALFVVGEDLGADRHLDDQIVAARAGAVGAGAALAARRAEMLGVAEVDQRIEARRPPRRRCRRPCRRRRRRDRRTRRTSRAGS